MENKELSLEDIEQYIDILFLIYREEKENILGYIKFEPKEKKISAITYLDKPTGCIINI